MESNQSAASRPFLTKEEWIAKAMKSACAEDIDGVLFRASKEDRDSLKEQTFTQIYALMGSEIMPNELQRAIVIKKAKFHPWVVVFLMIITLGLFHIFRPKDDDSILVLTHGGRVYLLKVERPSWFGADMYVSVMTFMRLMLILVIIASVPMAICMLFGPKALGNVGPGFTKENILQQDIDLEERIWKRVSRSYMLMSSALAVLLCIGGCWLYAHWPADYATRSRQGFTATSVSSVQYAITGGWRGRTLLMRLFFGKYPTQAALDGAGLSLGCSAGPVPVAELSDPVAASVGSGGNNSKLQQEANAKSTNISPAFITVLTVILSLVTIADAGFNWFDRIVAISHLATVREFCVASSADPILGPQQCTLKTCRNWAKDINYDHSFCTSVHWFEEEEEDDSHIRAICMAYGQAPPCCGGCTEGSVKDIFEGGWLGAFRTCLEVIGDIGTLLFSFLAAQYAMNVATATDYVEVTCQRAPFTNKAIANFDLIEPLAVDFLSTLFKEAWENTEDQQVVADPNPDLQQDEKDRGVLAFKVLDTYVTWEEFLAEKSIVEMSLTQLMVNVPRKCLGIHDHEQVIAGWSEMERMRPSDLMASFLWGILVFVLALILPWHLTLHLGGHTLVGGAKVLIGGLFSIVFMVLHGLYRYFVEFRQMLHAVIVTDMRLFYLRQKPRFFGLFGADLRVDAFRHDRNVFYGRCTNTTLPLWMRLLDYRFLPGVAYMQCKFGVLKLLRENGNAMDVFHVIAQLARRDTYLKWEDLNAADVSEAVCKKAVDAGMINIRKGVWNIKLNANDTATRSPDIYLCNVNEQMVYHWSMREAGALTSPYNSNTDLVITTDRVFMWTRPVYKTFDCKTACYYGACWCGCLRCLQGASQLPNTVSFLCYSVMLSFTSETQVEPPLWSDPNHLPIQFPCVEEMCRVMTNVVTFGDAAERTFNMDKCSCCPKRLGPRSQLFLMFRCRFNAQQPDLTCVVRPYQAGAGEAEMIQTEDLEEGFFDHLIDQCQVCERIQPELQELMISSSDEGAKQKQAVQAAKEVETIRKIMGVAQNI